ncbi:MAG: hypothetical protein ABIA02_02410, partial [Candidatus Falkowbacteria bacterium]
APSISGGSPSSDLSSTTTSTTISLTTNENSTCKYSTSSGTAYASITNTFSTTGATSHSQTITGLTAGTSYVYYIRCQDGDGNSNTDDYSISFSILSGGGPSMPSDAFNPPSFPSSSYSNPQGEFNVIVNQYATFHKVVLQLFAGEDTKRMAISNRPDFSLSTGQIPYQKDYVWNLCYDPANPNRKCPPGEYFIYIKFFTKYGVSSQTIASKVILQEEISLIEKIKQIPEKIKEIIPSIPIPFLKPKEEEPEIQEIPSVEETVKPDVIPLVFQGRWQLIPEEPIRLYAFSPLPKEIRDLAEKFPQLAETFKEIGIERADDVKRLMTTKLRLPGLTERAGLSLVKVKPGEFVLPQGVPVVQLSLEAKEKLPADIVFVKTANELIDFNISLALSDKGKPEQTISTIAGKPLQLVVKPDEPVNSIKGYLVFKSKKLAEVIPPQAGLDLNSLLASAMFAVPKLSQEHNEQNLLETRLVLLEFEYTDEDNDGIYTAKIQVPQVEGEYEIITVFDYENPDFPSKEIRLITVVDPEGYVYEKVKNQKLIISDAIVSLYWLNSETKQYELWPAREFQQDNPLITNDMGKYSFLVPEGTYYLKVEAPGYIIYEGKTFQVKQGSGIHTNIELKNSSWLARFGWERALLIILSIVLVLVIILLIYNFYRDKIRERIKKN